MRRLVFVSVLLLAACGDKQEVSQSSGGDFSPNQVAGRDAIQNVNVQNATINMPPEMLEKLAQALKTQGVPADQLNAQLEELKRKYADLEQRLGEYAKTDELAQQARRELDLGNLDQAETLLQQAYDKDFQLTRERLAQRAFDLAEVAELRLDHDKALTRYREVTQLQPDNLQAWRSVYQIANKVGNIGLALEASQGLQQNLKPDDENWLSIALTDEGSALEKLGDSIKAMEKYLAALELDKKRAAKFPDDTARRRDLSVSYNKVGDLYKANGDTPAALKAYQDSLLIAQKLVELDPKQAEWQRDLSVSYNKVGDLYKANGDTPAALKAYQDSLLIRNKLVELDPNVVQWRVDIAGSNGKLMLFYKNLGKKAEAIKHGEEALSILLELNKANKLDANTKPWITATESYLAELREQKK
jgi:tetratricopeptide (TPR) repeat protein